MEIDQGFSPLSRLRRSGYAKGLVAGAACSVALLVTSYFTKQWTLIAGGSCLAALGAVTLLHATDKDLNEEHDSPAGYDDLSETKWGPKTNAATSLVLTTCALVAGASLIATMVKGARLKTRDLIISVGVPVATLGASAFTLYNAARCARYDEEKDETFDGPPKGWGIAATTCFKAALGIASAFSLAYFTPSPTTVAALSVFGSIGVWSAIMLGKSGDDPVGEMGVKPLFVGLVGAGTLVGSLILTEQLGSKAVFSSWRDFGATLVSSATVLGGASFLSLGLYRSWQERQENARSY